MRVSIISASVIVSFTVTACAHDKTAAVSVNVPTAAVVALGSSDGDHKPHAGMLRFPDASATHITFVYANDVWVVPRDGGTALPLASPEGAESFPRFSHDGQTIAFVGNYDGNTDLYTIDIHGGKPHRVTHHPARETLCDWTPDGRLLYFTNAFAGLGRQVQLYTVSARGGLPEPLPVPYGANGSISVDGTWLAYTPHTRDHRTWKRYRGGMATDIWLFNLKDHTSKKITEWEGTDSQPMWHGESVYYLSDAGSAHRLNIWSYNVSNGRREQITHLTDYDVKWPAIGPGPDGKGEIVFQNGDALNLLNLATGELTEISVTVPGDRPRIRPHDVDASKNIFSRDISSTGKRAVCSARGDVWTLPAEHGAPRNLTRTSSGAERDPAWSPDGQWIAYFSDATGEYELFITQSDGKGETKQLTRNGSLFRYNPVWSPDSEHIAFTDKSAALYVYDLDTGETKNIDTDPWGSIPQTRWSPDSAWIVYTKNGDNALNAVWLYKLADEKKTQVTAGVFHDTWPTFDRKGKYLYLASNRSFSDPAYEDIGTTFIYADTDMLLVVPLRDEVGSPWAPKSDEESWGDGDTADDDDAKDTEEKSDDDKKGDDEAEDDDGDDDDDDVKPVEIELEGFERRAIPLPVEQGGFTQLAVNHEGKLLYVRLPANGSDGKPSIKIFDIHDDEKEEKTVLDDANGFVMSADGKKILAVQGDRMAIVDAAPDQKWDKLAVSTGGMNATINPRAEWRQLFKEAWRIERDFFYDPNMHGVDWNLMRQHYRPMLEDCASREDVAYVIGELISELNVGHAYVRGGGDLEQPPNISVGLLGVDFSLRNGVYRIDRIYEGAPWDVDARGPLSQPGVDVKTGDFLLAVNHQPLDPAKDPWAAFQGLGGKTVTLTVSDKRTMDDDAREVVVELLSSERDLRYRAWVEHNRHYVDEKTDGRVGYIYVPNTGVQGQNELFRQFYGQKDKAALIIDERWNGGGQIPTRFIELLNRPVVNYWATRAERDWVWPPDSQQGPKCMLINGLAGSGGDCFPWYFRANKLGKLIGMRTWGGLVGISGNPTLIDGGRISAPTFAFYETDGTWAVEGHGVDPDIEVVDDPALMVDGGDPQLDKAIEHMLSEIQRHPYSPPKRPRYPDRSGMGIKEADK